MTQRLLVFVLGFWLCLSFAMGYVASGNFRVVEPDALRNSTDVYGEIEEGPPRRMALRYVASELNRDFFARYDKLNLALSVIALVLLAGVAPRPRWSVPALLVVLVMALSFTFWFTPTLRDLGRQIDFVPRDPPPPEVTEFYRYHGINISMELTKMVILAVLGGVLIVRRPKKG